MKDKKKDKKKDLRLIFAGEMSKPGDVCFREVVMGLESKGG